MTIPFAWPGILSAPVLSAGCVFAESAPLIMTAGITNLLASRFARFGGAEGTRTKKATR